MPFGQLPPVEPELFERAREAVSAIRGRGRDRKGRAVPGNTIALRTGERSAQLANAPQMAAWHAEQVAAITADLGGESELSALARAHVREVARLEVIVAALGEELFANGVLTGKGKTRAATLTYLQVLDRLARMSSGLGLARRAKPVPTVAELLGRTDQ
jgi:hypothetical protein